MTQSRDACFRPCSQLAHKLRLASLCLIALACGLAGVPAAAQANEAAPSEAARQEAVCSVQHDEHFGPAVGSARPVVALCGGHGLVLGYADGFQVVRHEALQAVLIDLRRGSDRRVLMISLQRDQPPLLEDISGQISMRVGRGPMSSLEGLELDVGGFARSGMIGVRGPAAENAGTARAASIDLGQQIARVRTDRPGNAPQN